MKNFFLLAIVIVWGVNWPLMKIVMLEIPPLWFGTFRMAIATIVLSIFLILKGQFIFPSSKDKYHILVIGCLQIGIYTMLVNLGLYYNSVGHSVILVYSTPIWITPIAVKFFNEEFSVLKRIGFFLSVLGIAVLFQPLSFDWTNQSRLLGSGFLLLAAISWTIATLFTRYCQWQVTVIQLLPWQFLVATFVLLISALAIENQPCVTWTPSLITLIFYVGCIATAFAFWGMIEINRQLFVTTSSLAMLAVPLIGMLTSSFFLREPLTISLISVYILITFGIACGLFADRKKDLISE